MSRRPPKTRGASASRVFIFGSRARASARKRHGEDAARTGAAGKLYRPPMRFCNPLHDRKAQAEAAAFSPTRFVGAEKALEDVRRGLGWNSDAGIGDAQQNAIWPRFQFRGDLAARPDGVLLRISD